MDAATQPPLPRAAAPICRPQVLASQALTHIVAHHLRAAGFTTASERALQTLTRALEVYIGEMGRQSVESAQVCGRRVGGWEDVLGVLRDFCAVGEVDDVSRMVEREMGAKAGVRQGGVGAVLGARARRWRETRGKIGLEMSEEAAEEWLDDEEERRRAAVRRRSGLGPMDVDDGVRREERAERGHVKGLAPLRAHVRDGLESREECTARPLLHSISLPPPDRYYIVSKSPSPDMVENEAEPETPALEFSPSRSPVHVKMERSPSPRGVKRRRSSNGSLGTRGCLTGSADHPVFDEPYLPPLPGKSKHAAHDPAHYFADEDEDETTDMSREENGTSAAAAAAAAAIDSARRTALEIYTSGAIPYEQSTLAIAYDVSHLTAMKWRKPRGTPPALLPSAVSSLVKAHKASVEAASHPPASKSSRSFKIAAADALSATVGHPLLYALAGTTHQVPGLASGSGGATPRGNPFVPAYPIWAKTELPVNEAHERDPREKEVYPVKALPRESAPLGPTVALNLMPSPAMFNPRQPDLLRTLITEMAGHAFVDQPSRSGWLRPSALRQFTELQPPEAIKVDAATAAESGGELRTGMPYLYGDAVRAPGQLGSMDAKIRAAKAKDRKMKAAAAAAAAAATAATAAQQQQTADGTTSAAAAAARKLKISFAGASVARNQAEALAEQLEAAEALLRDQDEIVLRATWPVMSEERGDWQTLMEPPPPPPPTTMTTAPSGEQQNKRIIASGIGKRLSDILPPPPPPSPPPASTQDPANMKRKLVFKRPGEVTPVSESPPTPSVSLARDGPADESREAMEARPGLKFKLKLPMAS
ncbi:hypothetical protein NliqN6_5797 [Naganishia liquefaciens]|uniref:Bromodomain associated domain-containing protein n=1 Tax=Naganishia liquefaciens TaxID=104408 RepID=A0A8H3YGZ3_9TREE|nr:hypothetical protein NliqN6_5797 [Naganishia liquefaciens]